MLSGWRDGKFMRPALSITAHCSVSASSTSRAMPAGVRARRSQTITGFSAPTSSFAASAIAPESACGGDTLVSFGMRSVLGFVDRVLLQLRIEREQHRPHRRRHRDLVGAHRRLGEMLQRGRLVVPLGEVAHDRADVDRRVHPLGAGQALVGVDDIAAHDVDRHAIAPGVVDRHGGVLQPDHAVADHRHRLAFDLGVAVRHRDRDLLVRAGEDFEVASLPLMMASCRPRKLEAQFIAR